MRDEVPYQLLADAVLALHVAVVGFVVGGLCLILLGNLRHWRWVNGWGFRLAHASAIAIVVAQTWLGKACPLTGLEMRLREQGGGTIYTGSFVEHWLQRILYYDAPPWVFLLAYTVFGLVVVGTWYLFPPSRRRSDAHLRLRA